MMWLCKCQPSMEMRNCAIEWVTKMCLGWDGSGASHIFLKYWCSPVYNCSDMTYLPCVKLCRLSEDGLKLWQHPTSTLRDRDRLHALWHTEQPHTRPLWAWTSNYGCVFPLLFRSHFHFDTGSEVTDILASASGADLRKRFPQKEQRAIYMWANKISPDLSSDCS